MGIALGAMLGFVLLAAGPAMGSSVAVSGTEIVYTSDVANNLTVSGPTGDVYTFTDSLVDVMPGAGCVQGADAKTATCTLAGATLIRVNAGGGADTVTINSSTPAFVEVGDNAGGDTVTCGTGADTVVADGGDVASADCETVDSTPPDTSITDGPSGVVSNTNQPFTFTPGTGSSECDLTGPGINPDSFPCSSPQPLGLSDPPDGAYTFFVVAIDQFGRRDPTPAERSFTLDTSQPQITITQRDPTDTSTAHFQLDADEPDVTFQCEIVGHGGPASCDTIFTTPILADGDYLLRVTGTDAAGNNNTTDFPFKINAVKGGGGVGAPTPPAVVPKSKIIIESLVLISGRTVKMSRRGIVTITLTCAGTKKCTGRMKITTAEPVSRKSRKLVTLGSKRFSIGANKKLRVKTRFSKKRQRLARKLKRFKAKVVINEIDSRGNPRISSRVFTLRAR